LLTTVGAPAVRTSGTSEARTPHRSPCDPSGPQTTVFAMSATVKPTAQVDPRASLGDGTTVWELAQVRENASLGEQCIVGRGAYIGAGVRIGSRVKIQNHALVYEPARLADGVFIGPAAV